MTTQIVEQPRTKELFFRGQNQDRLLGFCGTPFAMDTTDWKVISTATAAKEWWEQPGKYKTYSGLATIVITRESENFLDHYTVGGRILAILLHAEDLRRDGTEVDVKWHGAYSCRNVARSAAEVEM